MFKKSFNFYLILLINLIIFTKCDDMLEDLDAVESIDVPSVDVFPPSVPVPVPSNVFLPPFRDDEDRPESFVEIAQKSNSLENSLEKLEKVVESVASSVQSAPVECGGTYMMTLQTMIKSPNYPENYPPNVNCEYLIKSPLMCFNEFHVQFLNFTLESSRNCQKDYVVIGESSSPKDQMCGRVIGIQKFNTSDGTLRIRFVSDGSNEKMGFKLLVTRLPCYDESDVDFDNNINPMLTIDNRIGDGPVETRFSEPPVDVPVPSKFYEPPYVNFATKDMEDEVTTVSTIQPVFETVTEMPAPTTTTKEPFIISVPDLTFQTPPLPVSVSDRTLPALSDLSRNIDFLQDFNTLLSRGNQHSDSIYADNTHVPLATTHFSPTTSPLAQPFVFPGQSALQSNEYIPPSTTNTNGYLPPTTVNTERSVEYLPPKLPPPTPSVTYIPPFPTKPTYLPPTTERVTYLPPTTERATYLPPTYLPPTTERVTYLPPTTERATYLPPRNNDYLPPKGQRPGDVYIPPFACPPGDFSHPLCQVTYPLSSYAVADLRSLPACCANTFYEPKFYLASQGFPNSHDYAKDCLYYIERTSPHVCRLRIDFKFFNIGDPLSAQNCEDDFVEIDNQRICGCRTGMAYVAPWEDKPKAIRIRMTGREYGKNSGVLLDVTQEPCSYRYSRSINSTESGKVKRHNFFYAPHAVHPQPEFFFVPQPSSDRCAFSLADWINLSVEAQWIQRPVCLARR